MMERIVGGKYRRTKMRRGKRLYVIAGIICLLVWVNLAGAGLPEQAKLMSSDGAAYDCFGQSVSISGDYAIVGAYGNDANGSAYIFKRDEVNWSEEAKLIASDGTASDCFGWSVSISGDYAVVGAPYDDDNGGNSGSAYIFKRDGVNWSEQAKLTASDGAVGDSFGYSVSISGDYVIIGAVWDDDNGSGSGSAYIFKRDGTSWSQQAKLTALGGAASDYFGCSVSISGDYAIIGANSEDIYGYGGGSNHGSAYIFKRDGTNWSEDKRITASDAAEYDYFGCSVSISGDYAIIGANGGDDNGGDSGSAYIFKRNGTNWSEQAKLVASDGAAGDHFGNSVSIGGDYAIVGAYWDDDNGEDCGSAYIFKRYWTGWGEQDKLTASDGATSDWFGYSVSIGGDYAIVGAPYDGDNGDNSGSAHVYSGGYISGAKWHDSDGDSHQDFDEQVIAGWRIYIDVNENGQFDAGEPNYITDANGSYLLNIPAGSWVIAEEVRPCWEQTYPGGDETYRVTVSPFEAIRRSFGNTRPLEIRPSGWGRQEQDKLLASDGAANDVFGFSVSVSGDYAIVGAYWDDDNGIDSGSAYIFEVNETNCGEWNQRAKLKASDGYEWDYFGASVSISGDETIVGAYFDDDKGSDSGSAYIFKRDGASWNQQAKLVASDGADGDRFGCSVSISGDYAIIGACYDDDNGDGSGSAYIFKRNGTSWSQQAKLVAPDGNDWDTLGFSVSIDGDYAIVGANNDGDKGEESGSAYIFRRDGASWYEQVKLTSSDITDFDYFGASVSINGGYAVVGASGDDDKGGDSGSAYIFRRDGSNWSEIMKLTAADGASNDSFGYSVSISCDYIISGACFDDDNGDNSGSAYVFGKVLCPASDLNGDCFVDFKDVAILAGEWLTGGEEP
jgi:hypothetical protein